MLVLAVAIAGFLAASALGPCWDRTSDLGIKSPVGLDAA